VVVVVEVEEEANAEANALRRRQGFTPITFKDSIERSTAGLRLLGSVGG
jgi:hypothetical protein